MAGEALLLLGLAGGALLVGFGIVLWRRRNDAPPEPRPQAPDEEGPPVLEHDVLHLRCGGCGTTFDVPDTGQRPLLHACPGCGRRGALTTRDPPP